MREHRKTFHLIGLPSVLAGVLILQAVLPALLLGSFTAVGPLFAAALVCIIIDIILIKGKR